MYQKPVYGRKGRIKMAIKDDSLASRMFDIINIFLMILAICITLYPFLYVVSISLSSRNFVTRNMVTLFPRGFQLNAYRQVFEQERFWIAYKNTIIYTSVGTFINLFFTCTMAYALSRKKLVFRKSFTVLVIFTMFFSGGMIPNFLLIKWLNMYNTIWAVVIPGAISAYNMIIVRTFMQGIPNEIIESVRIDGGNDLQIFSWIIIPLSKSVIATIGLFYAVGHWNSYFKPMIYLKDNLKEPLQVLLRDMIVEQNLIGMDYISYEELIQEPTSEMLVAASIVVAIIPMLCVYPYIQKYFVKGVMIGSLKG